MTYDRKTKIEKISFAKKSDCLYELYQLETDFSKSYIFRAFDGEHEGIELICISRKEADKLFLDICEGELSAYQLADVANDARRVAIMAKY